MASAPVCPPVCPTRPEDHQSAANANKLPKKNGPEIIDFRPVLGFLAVLANRRLRPLGHLTLRLPPFALSLRGRSC